MFVELRSFSVPGKPIFSIDIHPDGSRFATGGQGKYTVINRINKIIQLNKINIPRPYISLRFEYNLYKFISYDENVYMVNHFVEYQSLLNNNIMFSHPKIIYCTKSW